MATDKVKKGKASGKKGKKAKVAIANGKPAAAKIKKAAGKAGKRAAKLVQDHPVAAEVVAAALVAAAAALKDPAKARAMAAAAADELTAMGKDAASKGSALWKLALDIGRHSVEALGAEGAAEPVQPTRRKPRK